MKPQISQVAQITGGKYRGSGICISILLVPLLAAVADPATRVADGSATVVSAASAFVVVNHLGESEQQASLREGELLSHRRATDPFGNTIRGPYKALPQVVQRPTTSPGQPVVAAAAPAVNEPTIEKAVDELAIGAVNVGAHEILVGSRSIHEGDLLVLGSGGRQFLVWVQNVGVRGVLFCDIDLKKHLLKTFGSGPKELPRDSVWGLSELRDSNAPH